MQTNYSARGSSNTHPSGVGRGRGKNPRFDGAQGLGRGRGANGPTVFQNYAVQTSQGEVCAFCQKPNHTAEVCRNIGDPKEAFAKCYAAQLCTNCLQRGHKKSACPSKRPCGVDNCQHFHHKNLHGCRFLDWQKWFKARQRQQAASGKPAATGGSVPLTAAPTGGRPPNSQ